MEDFFVEIGETLIMELDEVKDIQYKEGKMILILNTGKTYKLEMTEIL